MSTDDKPWMNRTPYQVYIEALWAAPEGYVLVPIEPTLAMLEVVQKKGGLQARAFAYAAWNDMIAAAPTHEETNHG